MVAQPRRLVGEQARTRPRATSGSRSRRSRRACRRRGPRSRSSTPFPTRALDEAARGSASSASSLRLRLIARRSPSASPTLNPASACATDSTWSWKTTTPSVSRERLAQQRVVDRRHEGRVLAQPLAVLDVRVDGLALDRPRPDERDLDGQVVEVLGPRAQERSASARGSRSGSRRRCRPAGSRRRRPGRRAGCARGRSVSPRRRAIRSTQSSTAESIPSPSRSILRKPASAQESLSHWQIWRPAIAAGCTGTSSTSGRVEMTIPPGCCEMWRGRPAISRAELAERAPARRAELRARVRELLDLLGDAARVPLGQPREPLELGVRQAERLAEVADRAARVVGREGRDERGVLAAVALGDARRSASRGCRAGSRGRCPGRRRARG